MAAGEDVRSLADRIRAARSAAVFGRDAELARLLTLAGDERRGVAVVAVHGPGGVGKSTLVRLFADRLPTVGATPVLVDAADCAPTPEGVLSALAAAAGGGAVTGRPPPLPSRAVVIVDTFERLTPLERWFRDVLLPGLPADALVVTAGRARPGGAWRDAPGWKDLLLELPLRNLEPAAAAALLRARAVPERAVEDTVTDTYGHPLALVVAADLHAELGEGLLDDRRTFRTLLDHPDASARLLGHFVDDAVGPHERAALQVAGHARRVDRALLASVLEVDDSTADRLLGWLRARPYAQVHPDGLTVHDLVRDALDRDLAWRDRDAFERLHGAIRRVIVERMQSRTGAAQLQATFDLLDLHRSNPSAHELYGLDQLGTLRPRTATPDDDDVVRALVGAANGFGQADTVLAWSSVQPGSLRLFVDADDTVAGLLSFVRLDLASEDELRADPAAATVFHDVLGELRAPRPGEPTFLQRPANRHVPPRLGPISDMVAATSLELWTAPRLGWIVNLTPWNEVWQPIFEYIGCTFLGHVTESDGREVAVWGRDFSRSSYTEWLDGLGLVELGVEASAPLAAPVALARTDFDAAVRAALRDLRRVDRLTRSPLLAARLVAEVVATGDGVEPTAVLVDRIRAAVAAIEEDDGGRRGARAVDRTYVRPAGTQEKAAEVLGLPFSTYRRHLAAGLERVVEVLWAWELDGVPAEHDSWGGG